MECETLDGLCAPFPWHRIPQIYRQGHQRPLTLSAVAHNPNISDKTALQLSQLADEGLDLRIFVISKGRCNILKNFREKMRDSYFCYSLEYKE